MRCDAIHCNTAEYGLKIRRSQGRGGSTPPPGTNLSNLERSSTPGTRPGANQPTTDEYNPFSLELRLSRPFDINGSIHDCFITLEGP